MKTILNLIGNKKLTLAIESDNVNAARQIASKLYKKSRLNQDKKEILLAEILKFTNGEEIDEEAINVYNEFLANEIGLQARKNIQSSARYLNESDPLVRFDMKESAYEKAYNSACDYE